MSTFTPLHVAPDRIRSRGRRPARRARLPLRPDWLEARRLLSTITVMNLDPYGPGSLREAVELSSAGDTIDFLDGLSGTITLSGYKGPLVIDKDLTIAGPGPGTISVAGQVIPFPSSEFIVGTRVFEVLPGAEVVLSGLTIADGRAEQRGAAILNGGSLTLTDSVVRDNWSLQIGGGVHNYGTMTIIGSTITENTASRLGGGLYNEGTMTIIGSSISDNQGILGGGGIYSTNGYWFTSLTIIDTTISGNLAGRYGPGGGLNLINGNLVMHNSTVSGNRANGGGGIYTISSPTTITSSTITANEANLANGIWAGDSGYEGVIRIANSIIAGNSGSEAYDIVGVFESGGYNLVGIGSGATGYVATDLVGSLDSPIDPRLGPLQDNGGPTLTHLPAPSSPAIDAGSLPDLPPGTGPTDQRGVPRPLGPAVDIGAVEAEQVPGVISIARTRPELRNVPVEAVEIAFNLPIVPESFTIDALSLTRDGQAVPLGEAARLEPTGTTTFLLSGLGPLTTPLGRYELTALAEAVVDPDGVPGTGTFSAEIAERRPAVPGDFDGDGVADLALYHFDPVRGVGIFEIRGSFDGSLRIVEIPSLSAADFPVSGDFDGDGRADPAVFRPWADTNGDGLPDSAVWTILESSTGSRRDLPFGAPGLADLPAPADFDGDGITDLATFRPDSDLTPGAAQWFILPSGGQPAFTIAFGAAGLMDLPVPADYDGDGKADIATFRPESDLVPGAAQWFILPSSGASAYPVTFGAAGLMDLPVPADYDGDGKADIATFRPESDLTSGVADWFRLESGTGRGVRISFGVAGVLAAPSDYDPFPDGVADLAAFDPVSGIWTIRPSRGGDDRLIPFGPPAGNRVPVLSPLARRLALANLDHQTATAARTASDLRSSLRLLDDAIDSLSDPEIG